MEDVRSRRARLARRVLDGNFEADKISEENAKISIAKDLLTTDEDLYYGTPGATVFGEISLLPTALDDWQALNTSYNLNDGNSVIRELAISVFEEHADEELASFGVVSEFARRPLLSYGVSRDLNRGSTPDLIRGSYGKNIYVWRFDELSGTEEVYLPIVAQLNVAGGCNLQKFELESFLATFLVPNLSYVANADVGKFSINLDQSLLTEVKSFLQRIPEDESESMLDELARIWGKAVKNSKVKVVSASAEVDSDSLLAWARLEFKRQIFNCHSVLCSELFEENFDRDSAISFLERQSARSSFEITRNKIAVLMNNTFTYGVK